MAGLNEILAGGSESFRKANRALTGAVQADHVLKAKAVDVVAPAPPRANAKRDIRSPLGQEVQAEAGRTEPASRKPHVHFFLHRVNLLDGDNKFGACKLLLDAIRYAGLVPGDRERDIDLSVTQERVGSYKQEGTGVIIAYEQ